MNMINDEKDIYRAAKLMINQHGDRAIIEAMMKQNEMLSKQDNDGARVWQKIADAIEWMQIDPELSGEECH